MDADAPKAIRISSGVTIDDYHRFVENEDRVAISEFLHERLTERYIDPATTGKRHGFTMMAVACLMIEAIESFRQGWPHTKGTSKDAFKSFFATSPSFTVFQPLTDDFYTHIRCGILHQGETTDSWRILRKGPLYDPHLKAINASLFLAALRDDLAVYVRELQNAPWAGALWDRFRRRMQTTSENSR